MNINDINVKNLILEKDQMNNNDLSQRRVLYSDSNYFYKMWDNNFFYKKNFEEAFKKDFYSNVSLIKDIIINENGIVGYVNYKGKSITYESLNIDKLNNLIDRLYEKSKLTNIIYIDFTITNIVEHNDKYYIIDLEPVVDFNNLPNIKNIKFIVENNLMYYRNKFKDFFKNIEDEKFKTYRYATFYNKQINYGTANTRIFLEKDFLPKLTGSILFVGVNYYNDFYHKLVKNQEQFETIDILDRSIDYGSPYVHYIGDILEFNPNKQYDNVVFFGILGHDSDWETILDENKIRLCFKKLNSLVKINGTLLAGPATTTRDINFWNSIYNSELSNYKNLFVKKIDINYIWYGIKNGIK